MNLGKVIRKWIPILKLRDWDISYQYEHPASLGGAGARADISIERKAALISVCDPSVPGDPAIYTNQDTEHYIVHELLHLHFDTFFPEDRDSLEYRMAEQCIDQLAAAFIALDRRKR